MTHELFQIFKQTKGVDINLTLGDFLSRKDIEPKSISLADVPSSNVVLVTLGYVEKETKEKFHIITVYLGKFDDFNTTKQIEEKLESEVLKLEGVVCQDVTIENGLVIANFLAKQ